MKVCASDMPMKAHVMSTISHLYVKIQVLRVQMSVSRIFIATAVREYCTKATFITKTICRGNVVTWALYNLIVRQIYFLPLCFLSSHYVTKVMYVCVSFLTSRSHIPPSHVLLTASRCREARRKRQVSNICRLLVSIQHTVYF